VTSAGGIFQFKATARDSCRWFASSKSPFIAFPPVFTVGTASYQFEVSPNQTGQPRIGSIAVDKQTVVVAQDP
jgi:hypothetical protein